MKTALLLTGNARFSKDFDSQLENLQNSDIDLYIVFWRRNPGFDPKISPNWLVQTSGEVRDKLKPHLPPWYKIKYIELLNPELYSNTSRYYEQYYSNPINVWQQYNILKYCYSWVKELGQYDLIIRSRTDLGLSEPIDLKLAYNCLTPNIIYTPMNQRNGYIVDVGGYMSGFCDQFAIGLQETMQIYCNSVDFFDDLYVQGTKYNPEYLLQTVLLNHGILWPPTSFEIKRDEVHWAPIEHGKWATV